MGLKAGPGSVVTRKDHERVFRETKTVERVEYLAHRPVDFLDDVSVDAG